MVIVWLRFSVAMATALASRLLGTDKIETMDSWVQQHRFGFIYAHVRNWLAAEWVDTKEMVEASVESKPSRLCEPQSRKIIPTTGTFTSRMIQALEAISTYSDLVYSPSTCTDAAGRAASRIRWPACLWHRHSRVVHFEKHSQKR